MAELKALCVYCGSSSRVDPRHLEAAGEIGREAARRGIRVVFGGGRVGLMGVLADAALAEGGQVTGIIPGHLMAREVGHEALGDLQVVDTMHERKFDMCEQSDAFCVLPGGFGTLDETFEIVTWRARAQRPVPGGRHRRRGLRGGRRRARAPPARRQPTGMKAEDRSFGRTVAPRKPPEGRIARTDRGASGGA
jgi:uncharacterized protein (TIGR00730 family)